MEFFYVYILFSHKHQKFYIGYTADLKKRLDAHNHPQNKGWTARFQPWSIVYIEIFFLKKQAIQRERFLKSAKGRRWIKEVILKNPDRFKFQF